MAPSRKKGRRTAAAALNQWKIGDLVLAKLKGFPAWPAEVSEPEKWGYSSDRKKLLVYFYGTKQIAFCNYADIEAFTEEKKKSLLVKRQGKGADFVRAVEEIIDAYEKKYKSNSTALDNEGDNSQSERLEDSKSKSSGKSPVNKPELDNNSHSEYIVTSDNHGVIGSGGVTKTSAEFDYPQSRNTSNDEPVEIVQTISATRTTKKRTRNGPFQSNVIQRLPSRRRSKSSSGDKVQKSSMAENFTHEAVCEFNSNVSQESSLKKLSSRNGVPSSECSVENVSDTAADVSDAEEINKPRPNGKLDISNKMDSMNDKADHLNNNKASTDKRKRNSNRKPTTNAFDCVPVEKAVVLNNKSHASPCKSANCKEIVANFIKADGDEHLPLVKRARVRMGKQSLEETHLAKDVESRDEALVVSPMEESSSCPNKDASISSPVADCNHVDNEDSMALKVNNCQSEDLSLDIEAALPPSKRLHRALEAMSANAAESKDITDDIKCHEHVKFPEKDPVAVADNETICDTHSHSTKENPPNVFVSVIIQSPKESICIHSSDIASGLPSKGELANARRLRSPHTEDKYINSCINKELSSDHCETILQPCSSKPAKKLIVATANESMSDQLSPLDAGEKKKATLESSIRPSSPKSESVYLKNPDYVADRENDKLLPATKPAKINISSTASNTSGSAKSPSSQSDENTQERNLLNVKDDTYTLAHRDWSFNDSTPMKDLIAAAQKKRLLSRSTSFAHNGVDGKDFGDCVVSPLGYNKSDSSGQGSPGNHRLHHRPATDDRAHNLQNVNQSPHFGRQNGRVNKSTSGVEARKSFEALLSTLSRTKDSIGRATRMATDCAKYGIAGEVIESLLQHLEREPSMHKRVDLFFLIDSIIQFSRNQKGAAGDVYPSIVLPALPRLLAAAAPHGTTAWENRRQCLKVLRLWLDRKTFPESTVRHYIRELESKNEALLPTYSRRQARTERSLDDPIREMEGMLVDEYGSNTGFHLQNFIHPALREDEGESSEDDEKSFEAVTPEHTTNNNKEAEKVHHHILAEVDGELEMEDVAPPPCLFEHNNICAPPLPQVLPPSPPPLPSSPAPPPPPPPMTTYYRHDYGPPKHMPPPIPHRPYHLQPPPPSVSDQFSYIQPEARPRSWDANSYADRYEYGKGRPHARRSNRHGDYGDGDGLNKGPGYCEKPDVMHRYSPYSERTSSSSHGWSNYPAQQHPGSRVNRGRGYWQPR